MTGKHINSIYSAYQRTGFVENYHTDKYAMTHGAIYNIILPLLPPSCVMPSISSQNICHCSGTDPDGLCKNSQFNYYYTLLPLQSKEFRENNDMVFHYV